MCIYILNICINIVFEKSPWGKSIKCMYVIISLLSMQISDPLVAIVVPIRQLKQLRRATEMKATLEKKYLGNGDYFVIIASSSHPLLLTEHASKRVKGPLK